MSPRMLNFVIAFSMIGILGIVVKEKYIPSKPQPVAVVQQDTAQNTQLESAAKETDPAVTCASDYFNFNPKSIWKYKLSTGAIFTSSITSSSNSTVTITSKLPDTKDPLTSTLTCKKSGIYGLPFIPISSKSIPQSVVDSILLVPSTNTLTKGQTWESSIDLGINIPLVSANGITIKSTVEKVTDVSATIASTLDLGSIPVNVSPIKGGKILEYTLVKGVGVSELRLLVGQTEKTLSGLEVTLTGYSQK